MKITDAMVVKAENAYVNDMDHGYARNECIRSALTAALAAPVAAPVQEDDRAVLIQALADATKAENSNARRMRNAIVEARRQLAKGRALWNGPCIQCDHVLEQALRAISGDTSK